MRFSSYSNFRKVAIIGAAMAIIAVCSVAGTLAAFDATYKWESDTASPGDFGFEDTSYHISLFGDDGIVVPGESGKSLLSGPSFGESVVTWSFTENNEDLIPVIFYLESADGKAEPNTLYSKYYFSAMGDCYFETQAGGSMSLAPVSQDVSSLVSALSVGKSLCWVWPLAFYVDAECTTEIADTLTEDYEKHCKTLCSGDYAFSDDVAASLNGSCVGYATGGDGSAYNVLSCSEGTVFAVSDGIVTADGNKMPLRTSDGTFYTPASVSDLRMDSALLVFSPASSGAADKLSSALTSAGITFKELGYYIYSDGVMVSVATSQSGARTLFAVYPAASGTARPAISVTVTAVVEN